ncbi:Hpt domain-containing protein [bacterium]|nr:Hpt domain-containing protein [bacterium]
MDKNIFDYQDAIERVGDEELLYELLDDFLEFSDEILSDIEKAVKEGNSTMIRNSGHTLKGTAANLSLQNLSDIGLEIETAGKAELTDKYEDLFARLQSAVAEFKKFMQEK